MEPAGGGRIYEIDGVRPVVDPTAFVHPDATIVGDVIVGPGCYIAPLASLRGDFGRIVVGRGTNVQDSCVLHAFPGRDMILEEDAHVGHGAVLHGCSVGRGVLVGMNSVVMDGATIGDFAFIAANSFVPGEFEVPARHLVAGTPVKVRRELGEDEIAWKANGTRLYQELAVRSRETLRRVDPLTEVAADRPRVSTDRDAAAPLREFRR
jgi:phenylacetic acid degradation protein